MARCWIEAGRLSGAWGAIRKSVEYARFLGHKVELFEGAGWLSRHFEVRGDDAGVRLISEQWREWAERDMPEEARRALAMQRDYTPANPLTRTYSVE